jgi:hypothetical protein
MLLIRETFVAKPGQASTLAKLLQSVFGGGRYGKCRILTDLTGDFNRVVMETEVESLAAFENAMKEYQATQAVRDQMKGYTDLYITGGREVFRIW